MLNTFSSPIMRTQPTPEDCAGFLVYITRSVLTLCSPVIDMANESQV